MGWTTVESWFGSRRFEEIFPSSSGSRPALGNIHHPRQTLGQAVFPVTKRSVLKLTAHLHLVSRLRISGAIPPLLHMISWRAHSCVHLHNIKGKGRDKT